MPKNLPLVLVAEKNKLNMDDPWLEFIHVVIPSASDLFFVNNTEDVTWQSQLYAKLPFTLGLQRYSDTGTIPSLELKLSNVDRMMQPYIDALDGLMEVDITLSIVSYANLADPHTELTVEFQIISTLCDEQWVTFTLGTPNPLRQRFPLQRFIANTCNWVKHFKGVECKYVGAETICAGTLDACEAYNNTANFGGHPGLNTNGIRIAR